MRSMSPVARSLALVVLLAGCPKSAPSAIPAAAPAVDPRIGKLARILRAEDRRLPEEELLALAVDDDPAVRSQGALALGRIGLPESVQPLERLGADLDPGVRASAAYALGLIAAPASQGTLSTMAGDGTARVRAAAVEALGRIHDTAAEVVRARLSDDEASVRAAAGLAAWKFPDAEPLLEPLISNLAAENPEVRASAAYALARLASAAIAPASSGAPVGRLSEAGVGRARRALAERVTDGSREVRMQVARGLASPRSDGPELAIVGALSRDPDPGVRVNAVRSLGYPGIPIKPYLERALADKDQGVLRVAIESIGRVGGAPAEAALHGVLPRLEKGWLQEAAFAALAKVDPTMTPDLVNGLLLNPDPVMRASAATLLAGRSEPGAHAAAERLLADPEARVQAAAIPVVAEQEDPVTALLAGKFTAADPVVRAAAAEAVGSRFGRTAAAIDARDDLFARLDEVWGASSGDALPDAKLAVVDAAAKAGKDGRTAAILDRALADPDVVVRRRAAARFLEVYRQDRSRDVGPAADRPLADYERIVRWAQSPHTAVVTMQRPGAAAAAFTLALDATAAPLAAWNFAELAGKRFYDGATLHRVVPNFVVQDGDPRGDGFGGPGYSIRDEFNPLAFEAGVVGMASDGKDTAGSQWFVTLSAQPHLDGRYTSFGRVERGLREVVAQLRPGDRVVTIRIDEGSGGEAAPGR